MKKKKFLNFEIAELSVLQVKELMEFIRANKNISGVELTEELTEERQKLWEERQWRTIMLSLNNAVTLPTKENPLGSESGAYSRSDIAPSLGFASFQEINTAIYELSGLAPENPGELKAVGKN